MENKAFANLANYNESDNKKHLEYLRLTKALDTLSEFLNIDFGSVTIHFHRGQWTSKLEICKSIFKELDK